MHVRCANTSPYEMLVVLQPVKWKIYLSNIDTVCVLVVSTAGMRAAVPTC